MGKIKPAMWDHPRVRSLSVEGKLMWAYLLTCPQPIPGLMRASETTLAESLGVSLRRSKRALNELRSTEMIEFDPVNRVLRTKRSPRHNPPGSSKVVRGWFRRWSEFPACAIVERHIASIEESCRERDWYQDIWPETFGSVTLKQNPRQGTLFPVSPKVHSEKGIDTHIAAHSEAHSDSFIDTHVTPMISVDRKPRSGNHRGIDSGTAERALWQRQEELRSDVPGLAPLSANPDDLARVRRVLAAGHSVRDCEHVLAVYHAQAKHDPDKRKYFNGQTNWRLENFRYALGMPVSTVTPGAYSPTNGKKAFSGGSVI